MTARWGFFGGTFDPVHRAHVALAHVALQHANLDEVRWVPAGQPWQKTRHISAPEHREAMVRLAIEGEPRFVLDRIELERSGPTYTVETLEQMVAERPGTCVLILGADQYARLHTWHRWADLLPLVELAVAQRPGTPLVADPAVAARPVTELPLPAMDVSASDIRTRAALGHDISKLVPDPVARYIGSHRLYEAVTGS